MAEEKIFYSDSKGVMVTSTRFIVGRTTYPIAAITSITTLRIPAKRDTAIWMIAIGALVVIFGFPLSYIAGVLGIAVLAMGVMQFFKIKDTHILKISTAAGEIEVVKSTGDPDRIQNIARALNEAIAQRGY